MKKDKIIFWVATGFIFLFDSVLPALTSHTQVAVEGIQHLGFPDYFRVMLTIFKITGGLLLILPIIPPRMKEWAYAGFGFNFISAAVAHGVVDGVGNFQTIMPLIIFAILAVSYLKYHKLLKAGYFQKTAVMKYATPLLVMALVGTSSIVFGQNEHENNQQFSVDTMNIEPDKSGYAPVNGLKLYYEIYGTGQPLVLLHGSFMNIDMCFGEVIPELSKNRQIIAVELQGHGRTADIDRPMSFSASAKDVIGLLEHLNVKNADVFGYSMGGGVALQVAAQRPDLVRKLVIASAVFKYDGWHPIALEMFPTFTADMFEGTPMKTEYERLAPDPTHWKAFVPRVMTMDADHYNWKAELEQKASKIPAFIIVGDADGVMLEHVTEMYHIFGGGVFGDISGLPKSQLAILPATTHVGVMMQTDWLLKNVPAFLDAPM